jgi:hypothetical protein
MSPLPVSRRQRWRRPWRATAALPWLVACVYGQAWADPMRPLLPPANVASAASARVATAPVAGGPAERTDRAREADAPRELDRLVAIRQDSGLRWQALLGERWVRVGDRLDNYTVGAIDANTVQLADGRQRRTLHLLPPLWRPGPKAVPLASHPPEPGGSTDLAQAGPAALSSHRATGLPSP